ncbi:MAG: hypothetical protein HY537_09890 [Deltaproteobacteria bacterium]|nr:hypothetical protein [Deltaproteobacteria bacterium]
MLTLKKQHFFIFFLCLMIARPLLGEPPAGDESFSEEPKNNVEELPAPPPIAAPQPVRPKRKYFIEDPQRIDAGIFHVAFAAGGNFYIEPKLDANRVPLGDYFKDFGFQGGAYFDYDYDDINLGLRGFLGYKYILNSVHVFTFDPMVRYLWKFSDKVHFGLGVGGSAAIWFRKVTDTSGREEVAFIPSLLLGAGFDFNPFMVDFKWLINRIGPDSTIMGWEGYFGFRL